MTRYMITPEDTEKEALKSGLDEEELTPPEYVILTFNKPIIAELENEIGLEEWEWPAGKYSPYSGGVKRSWKGEVGSKEVGVFVPHMGASPIAALAEELIHYGAEMIFLLCASWSLGEEYLKKGQIHLPSFSTGVNGTSVHYNNGDYVEAEGSTYNALKIILSRSDIDWKEGGVGCCEAFYRIDEELFRKYREEGCLSMENGEVSALYSVAEEHDFPVGVLLQPYIDLEQGLNRAYIGDEYVEACRNQAKVVVELLKER